MISLVVDASTYRGTVAIFRDRELIAGGEGAMRGADADALMPAVVATLGEAGLEPTRLDAIICGEGPGSFTSLRIAAAIAKGLCVGAARPLYAISSLGLLLANARPQPGRYLVVLDALRDEWYAAIMDYLVDGQIRGTGGYGLLPKAELDALARAEEAQVIGAALEVMPDARAAGALIRGVFESGPVDLATWEPSYGRLAEAQVKWEAAHGRALRT